MHAPATTTQLAVMNIREQILSVEPGMDQDLVDYVLGYLVDSTSDFSSEALSDFLVPLFSNDITEFMQKFIQSVDDAPLLLSEKVTMTGLISNTISFTQNSKVDIRHGSTKIVKSQVDQKKLLLAEKRLALKRAERTVNAEYESAIPTWDPDVKPAIVVNQLNCKYVESSRSKDIILENFDIQYAGKKILENANLSLVFGKRYGLVGKNGVGKSTLLRAISSKELVLPSYIKVLHVEQEIEGGDGTALASVLDADVYMNDLLKEEKELNVKLAKTSITPQDSALLHSRLKVVYQDLHDMEADKAEARASAILHGLGFSPEQQNAATRTFSGGWRMRLALARALFCRPDLLLADEVTNYLDFPAVVWLENYFQNWATTLLVVSHDKSFLNAVATDILHLHDGQLDVYKGNFATFVATKSERRKNEWREYESQLQYRQHLQAFIDRWRYNAKRAAQAQSKIKILEKLGPLIAPPKDDMDGMGESESVYFRFPNPEQISPPILQADAITFGYTSERIILSNICFDVRMDSKIAVVGPNGAGKSTLIKVLTGDVNPLKGLIHRHGRLRLGLFSQHHVDQLELALSSVQFLSKQYPAIPEEEIRRVLGRYGLGGTSPLQPIGTLSGGQKTRTAFAALALSQPHVLILDEPTNHLDMDSIDALTSALVEFKGGLLIVSHDQTFLDSICQEVWICNGGTLSKFEGSDTSTMGIVEQYKKSLLES